MSERKRVLLVTRNFPPLVGGMERLNWHIADELSRSAEVCVIVPVQSMTCSPKGVEAFGVKLQPLGRFLLCSLYQSVRRSFSWRPSLVLAGSGLTALHALVVARLVGARAAVYIHGLDVVVRHWLYRALWYPAIRSADVVIANSAATASLARSLGVDQNKIKVVHPGVMVDVEKADDKSLAEFRESLQLENSTVLLSVGRLSARKGILEFVINSLPQVVAQIPDALLVVVGDAPKDALYSKEQTREEIQAAADLSGVGKHIRFLGRLSDSQLTKLFQCASVHVFPIRSVISDPEGFGMVAIEAAAHGIPTVAFSGGGVAESVAEGRSGHLIPPEDYELFSNAVINVLRSGRDHWFISAKQFASEFDWKHFGRRLVDALDVESD